MSVELPEGGVPPESGHKGVELEYSRSAYPPNAWGPINNSKGDLLSARRSSKNISESESGRLSTKHVEIGWHSGALGNFVDSGDIV